MASLIKDRHGNLRVQFRVPGHPQVIRESIPGGPFKATRENKALVQRTLIVPLKHLLLKGDLAGICKKFPESQRLKAINGGQGVSKMAQTVGQFAREEWLREFVQRADQSTLQSYETILHRWIEPCQALMERPIAELTPADGAAFVTWLTQRPGSAAMRNKALKQLQRILKRAQELGVLKHATTLMGLKPFKETDLELIEQREHELGTWTLEERECLITAAYEIAEWQGHAVTVAFFTGMRRGELFGLQWRDLDFAADKIRIGRSLGPNAVYPSSRLATVFDDAQIPAGNQHESLPKTAGSRGTIEMLSRARDALLGQRESLGASFVMACPWVFPNLRGDGPQQVHNFSNRLWPKIVERAKVPYRGFQQTRHSFSAIAIGLGAELLWVQRMLRHTSLQMLVDHYVKNAKPGPLPAEVLKHFAGAQGVSSGSTRPPEDHPVKIGAGTVTAIRQKIE
jgi:integrase